MIAFRPHPNYCPPHKEMATTHRKFIGFYCTPTEARKIKAAAKRNRRSVSSYIRAKLLAHGGTGK